MLRVARWLSVVLLWLLCGVAWAQGSADDVAVITVHVYPPDARLWVDGVAQPEGAADVPLKLSPGEHRLEARLRGHEPVWRVVVVKAGRDNEAIELRLTPTHGTLVVQPLSPQESVAVDGRTVGKGEVTVLLPAGVYEVRVFGKTDTTIATVVERGKASLVVQESSGVLRTDRAPPGGSTSSHTYKPPWTEPPPIGIYAMVYGVLLGLPGGAAKDQQLDDSVHGGGGGSLRLGYRFVENAGAEAIVQYSVVGAAGTVGGREAKYGLGSVRIGAMARLVAPGRTMVRFVAGAGGGAVWSHLDWTPDTLAARYADTTGWGGFAQLELGVELEHDGLLADIAIQNTLMSTGGLAVDGGSAFDGKLFFAIGPMFGVGYGFW